MKTYIFTDTNYLEYELFVAVAEDCETARKIIKETIINPWYDKEYLKLKDDDIYTSNIKSLNYEYKQKEKLLYTEPIIVEPNQAIEVWHANE